MDQLEQFRAETREWLEANCPEGVRGAPGPNDDGECWGGRKAVYKNPDTKLWLDRMGAKGWTTPEWPAEYGGGGLNKQENKILQEELRRIGARPALLSFGIWMLGPVLLQYGTEEQKQQHIPKIVRGEIRWCQGYSEPGAGSDLAGLQTKAEDKGDHWLVNGSKIWTSYADQADWIFCLVRTDTTVKHDGISFLLFDMESEGVTTKPIKLISGASPFCETFFDDVKVPKDHLMGELNKGWTIAKALLQHERNMISEMGRSGGDATEVAGLDKVAKTYLGDGNGPISDASLRDAIAKHQMNDLSFGLTLKRAAEEAKSGLGASAASSMFKYYGTEQNKRKYELMLECMGEQMLGWEGEGFEEKELGATRAWLRSKANSIEGGTTEVQMNVIAKRVLDLPD